MDGALFQRIENAVDDLKQDSVEVPSDFSGVVYLTYDSSKAWRQDLAQELEAAGFEIDWNKVMRNKVMQ